MPSTAVNTTLGVLGGLAGAAIIAWPLVIWWEVRKCEKPKFTVVRTLGQKRGWLGRARPAAEVRLYAPYLLAEVTVSGSMEDALSSGFRQVAGFIFGKNVAPGGSGSSKVAMTAPVTLEASAAASQKIAMTAPVTAEMGPDATYKVAFVMPSQYTRDTLPQPVNPNVHIKEMPARTLAAVTWAGKSPREGEVAAKEAELRALLSEAGLTPKGPVHCWQFDPPFQWRWFRTNEVLLEVEGDAAAS